MCSEFEALLTGLNLYSPIVAWYLFSYMKHLICALGFFFSLASFASANLETASFPALEVLSVNVSTAILQKSLASTLDSITSQNTLAACLTLGKAIAHQQNLLKAAAAVNTVLQGTLITAETPPDWVYPLGKVISPVSGFTLELEHLSQPCSSLIVPAESFDTASLQHLALKINNFSIALQPYVLKAIAELYHGEE